MLVLFKLSTWTSFPISSHKLSSQKWQGGHNKIEIHVLKQNDIPLLLSQFCSSFKAMRKAMLASEAWQQKTRETMNKS